MSDVEPVEILRYARDVVLADESRWYQGGYSDQSDPEVPAAFSALIGTRFCALGAAVRAQQEMSGHVAPAQYQPAWNLLTTAAEGQLSSAVVNLNDHPDTTYSDVIDLFDRAIKKAEEPA